MMTRKHQHTAMAILAALAFAACSPDSFEGADPNGIPTIDDADFTMTVDQETNQMIANYNPKPGTYPIWILNNSAYSTLNEVGYKNDEAGTYTVELKLGNRNGFSQRGITKTFTFNETKVDYTADFRRICDKEWRIANKEVAHLACGPAGTAGTEWWSAQADEKKAFGLYDDRITFTATTRKGGTYTYDPGADGMTYVNTGTTKWGGSDADFDTAIGSQSAGWSFEVLDWTDAEGKVEKQTYIKLDANTAFPYISSDAQYEAPLFRIESLTAKKMVLIYEAPDRSIAWRFIFTSEAEEKEFAGFDANSDYNMWKNAQFNMFFWYAPGWNQIADPAFEANGNDYTVTLNEATTDQWQAQMAFKTTNISTSAAHNYDFSCIINSDKDLNGATVKLVMDGDDNVFYFTDRIDLKAGEDYIFWKSDMPGIDMERVNLFFDFGGCQAGTHVNISNIVLKDHANDDGTVLPTDVPGPGGDTATFDWDINAGTNLWKAVEDGSAFDSVTPWFADNSWSQIGDPVWSHNGNTWQLTIPEGMGSSQWQGQFPIHTKIAASAAKKYNLYLMLEADNDCPGVTIKLTDRVDDGNYMCADRHEVKADVPFIYKLQGATLSKGEDSPSLSLFFDFGGTPAGTVVKISKIYLEEAVSLSYDDANNLWKAVDEGSAFDGVTPWFANDSWSQIGDPVWSHEGNKWKLTIPEGMGGSQWQGQFPIHSSITAAGNEAYNFSCTVTADNDCPGVTIKLTDRVDDGNYFCADRHDVKADEPFVYTLKGATLSKGEPSASLSLFFDFGGTPVGTNIVISDIILEKAQ